MIWIETKRLSTNITDGVWAKISAKEQKHYVDCYVCGMPVDTRNPDTRWLRVVDGGNCAAESGADIHPPADCGLQPIGPECLKKQPKLRPIARTLGEWSQVGY
jgi:hypothetical protein